MYLLEQFLKSIYANRFSGEMLSVNKGEGYDLDGFSEYQVGDSVKKINWKLSAKYDKEYISNYKQDKEAVLDVFIDKNINCVFFKDELKRFLSYLENYCKKLGILVNYYVGEDKFVEKVGTYEDIVFRSRAKSNLDKILNSSYFTASKKRYKIIVSDFLFLNDLSKFQEFFGKLYFAVLPVSSYLSGSFFPVLNGYFNYFFSKDLVEKYNQKLEKLSSFGYYEKIGE